MPVFTMGYFARARQPSTLQSLWPLRSACCQLSTVDLSPPCSDSSHDTMSVSVKCAHALSATSFVTYCEDDKFATRAPHTLGQAIKTIKVVLLFKRVGVYTHYWFTSHLRRCEVIKTCTALMCSIFDDDGATTPSEVYSRITSSSSCNNNDDNVSLILRLYQWFCLRWFSYVVSNDMVARCIRMERAGCSSVTSVCQAWGRRNDRSIDSFPLQTWTLKRRLNCAKLVLLLQWSGILKRLST